MTCLTYNTLLQPSPVPEPPNDFITRRLLNITEGEGLLLKFRTDLMPLFPFVILPEVSFAEPRNESPFLLLCIMTACLEHKPALQQKLELEARAVVSTRIVMSMERDMDLLGGYWFISLVYLLLQMAMTIVVGLGLDRHDNFSMQRISRSEKQTEESQGTSALFDSGRTTCLLPRAFLGCYYPLLLTNKTKTSIFRRQLTMKHTDWVECCAHSLGQRAEYPYPTDQSLKALIEIQALVQKSEREDEDPTHEMSKDELFQSIDLLENRIERLLAQGPQFNTWSLRLELNATPVLVLGHTLRQQRDVHAQHEHEKQHFLTIARSALNIVTVFLASPASVARNLPMSSYTTIWYGLLVLSKLSLLSDTTTKDKTVEVHHKDIHDLGLAVLQKMEAMSRGDDPHSVRDRGNTSIARDAENANTLQQSVPEDPFGDKEPAAAVTEDCDATVWQQMVQDLTWIGWPVEQQQSAVDLAYMP
ncbi:uncharacterized protein BDW47DRAFT_133290 [Aspergillus candidus]|uniref:Transcription factor domain-containing protein n=1 Tax=Aspergillus candidus TaxID=41067 RepID=A0A2I2F5A4_ASPCN|nr:hypothetical protein BDW47DRAFT_133290 [Aspergillus candidus]PLB35804.1 hypothetical protein BDW47DRAFT_133290 [Aspergillus candidus]